MVDATELKKELGQRAKEIISQGLNFHVDRNKRTLCPLHNEERPSMSWFSDGLMWRCHSCQGHIDIYTYLTDFKGMEFLDAVKEVANMLGKEIDNKPIISKKTKYELPKIKTKELSQPFINYMAKRKIKKETLEHWRVKQRNWNGSDVYVFQYFNEKEKLEYVSYRGLGKGAIKGGCESNTKAILWGMWNIDKSKPVVITEGQPDAMAVWQSGYKNVVSVPNGSSNLKWIEHCWEWLQDIKEILVFADNDSAGLDMAKNIQRKLKNVKMLISERKDANEVLFFEGEEEVKKLIDNKLKEMPSGLQDLSEIDYKSAMEIQEQTIETGFFEYDRHVEDWKMQELTVIFGRNGEGKTTFISQILAHNIEKNVKTFLYSGEMSEQKIQNWLYRQLIGNNKEHLREIITKYRNKVEPKPDAIKRIKNWHKGKLFLYDRTETEIKHDLDDFFRIMELAAKRYGVKLFVVDNLMAILEENADSLNSDQANFVQRCKDFSIKNNIHIVLLAHPKKGKDELTNQVVGNLDKTDISGSNNIPNKADNIIAVERLWGDDRDCDAIVTSLKDRETGQRKSISYYFSSNTLRFYNNITSENKVYSWNKIKDKKEIEFAKIPDDAPF